MDVKKWNAFPQTSHFAINSFHFLSRLEMRFSLSNSSAMLGAYLKNLLAFWGPQHLPAQGLPCSVTMRGICIARYHFQIPSGHGGES
jgi:hypothetical protein